MASTKDRLVAGAFAGLVGMFRLLPVDKASALGAVMGRWLGPLATKRHDQARRNLERFIGGDVGAIRRAMWAQIGRVVGELPHLQQLARERVEIVGREHFDAASATGRSVLLVTGHIANWELTPFIAAANGVPLNVIVRPAQNPLSEAIFQRLRAGGAVSLIPKGQTGMRQVLKLVRKHEHFGFLVDQRFSEGIAVPFFGVPSKTTPAAASLALRHDAIILPAHLERLGGAHFRLTVEPPLALDGDVAALTAALNARLEAWIRAHPEQWLWTHRRWPEV
ncbi:MAG: lysophospholipid acyltransferase family protein [Roseitalea porphyridii]